MDPLYGYESVEKTLQGFYDNPCHIFLTGSQGSGKTSIINNFLRGYLEYHYNKTHTNLQTNDASSDIFFMNSHQDRGIHTVRNILLDYVRQPAKKPKTVRWIVIDHLESFPELSQQALRRPMELYSHVACFIFIGTNKSQLIPPLLSRCHCITLPDINIDTISSRILQKYNIPNDKIAPETIQWLVLHSNGIIREFCQYIKLIHDFFETSEQTGVLTKKQRHELVLELCSIPSFEIYFPLITSILQNNTVDVLKNLTKLWVVGESFEDVFDAVKKTIYMFGYANLEEGIKLHEFLMKGWVQYSQGYTSYRSLLTTGL